MAVEDRLRLERDTGKRGAQGRDPDDDSEVEPWPTARRARSPETGTHVGRPRRRRAKVALRDVARAVGERRCVKGGSGERGGAAGCELVRHGREEGFLGARRHRKRKAGRRGSGRRGQGRSEAQRDEGRAEPGTQEGGARPQGPGLGLRLPSFAGDGVLGIL